MPFDLIDEIQNLISDAGWIKPIDLAIQNCFGTRVNKYIYAAPSQNEPSRLHALYILQI
jgi:hypothetical protein